MYRPYELNSREEHRGRVSRGLTGDSTIMMPLLIGGGVAAAGVGGYFLWKHFNDKKEDKKEDVKIPGDDEDAPNMLNLHPNKNDKNL